MSKLKAIIFILFCIAAFASCKKENDRPQWDVGILGPLAKGSLGINNLINDTLLKTNPDSSLTLVYNKNLYTLNIDSFVSIPDTTVTTVVPPIAIPVSYTITPNQTLYQNTDQTRLAVNNVQLRYAIVKSGKLRFNIKNKLRTKVLFTYTLPKATLNNIPLSITSYVDSATSAGSSFVTSEYDLSGYNIDLTGTDGKQVNAISYYLQAVTDSAGPKVVLPAKDTAIIVQDGFIGFVPYYAKGYLGQTTLNIGPDSTMLDLFKSVKSGTLNLAAATMKLTIENDIGMDAQLKILDITSLNSHTNHTVSLFAPSLISQTLNINRAGASGTDANPSYNPTFYPLQIDNSNSNFVLLLNNLPDHLIYKLNLITNPLGNVSGDNDFAFSDHLVNTNLNMEIPLNFSSDHLTLSDTAAFTLSGDTILNNLGAGSFTFNVDNGFPFTFNITLVTIDSLNHFLDMLVSSAPVAAPPLDSTFKVISKARSQFIIPVDDARIALLRHAKRMVVTAVVTSAPPGGQRVKIYSDYSLDFKLIADLIYHVR